MKPAAGGAQRRQPSEARLAIERFLAASRSPAYFEPGDDPIAVTPGNYALEWRSGYLVLEVWNDARNVARRVTAVTGETRARLELEIERFGKRTATVALVDQSAAQNVSRRTARLTYREQFRRGLLRQFPGWRVAELSTEADLEHSLSPAYPRAMIRNGASAWAAIGAGPESEVDGALTFGLIWLDYLRARERRLTVEGLAVFLPEGRERVTCLRMRWLNPHAAQFAAFVQFQDGYIDRIDLDDHGNLDTRLERATRAAPDRDGVVDSYIRRLLETGCVETVPRNDGEISVRVRGLEFARTAGNRLLYGLETRRQATASNLREIVSLAATIAELRDSDHAERTNPLYSRSPEGWLESQVRANLQQIDAGLEPAPVYGQVPAFTAGERDVIDLLAVDGTGRLAVIELKASEDIQLPLQSLDYWMRVRWHAARGDFSDHGYFPGIELRRDAPRLLLVAPSLDFHPANDTLLRYYDTRIEVERIGIGTEWRKNVKVMFRHGTRH